MRLRFFLVEALRSIKTNVSISVAATITVLNAVFILGAFIPVYMQVQSEVDAQKAKLDVSAYIDDLATVEQVNGLRERVKANPKVKTFVYVSKEDALVRLRQRGVDPDVLKELPTNPLPASFEIKPNDAADTEAIKDDLRGHPALDKQDPFTDGGETARRVLDAANIIEWSGLALICVLMIASILQIANTIRLSIFARRREVEVMKLVGGTNWFIRWPFIIEGIICGVAGAVVSVLILWAVKVGVVDALLNLSDSPFAGDDGVSISFPQLALLLVAAGAVVGAIGSAITMRRFLRV